MEVFMRESLLLEKDKGKEHGDRIMEMSLKVTITMMSSMDGVNLLGKMDKSMRVNFKTIFEMVLDNISIQKVKLVNIFG